MNHSFKKVKKGKQRQFVNKEVQELEDEAISGEKLFGEPMDKPPHPPIPITPMTPVPTHARPSGHTGIRKAVKGFQTFEAHSTSFRSPIGAPTPFSKNREIFRTFGTRKPDEGHHGQTT